MTKDVSWSNKTVITIAILIAAMAAALSWRYVGATPDAMVRIQKLEPTTLNANETHPVPLWTLMVGAVAGVDGLDEKTTIDWLRYGNILALFLGFLCLIFGRTKSLAVLGVALTIYLPIIHGAIPNASYDAWLALILMIAVRCFHVNIALVSAAALGLVLVWGADYATWDVVNLYAALGEFRQPLDSLVGLVATSIVLLQGGMFYIRSRKAEADKYAAAGVVLLAIASFAPGMVRGVEWFCLPFFFEAFCRDRRWLVPTAVLGLVIFFDHYGIFAFNHVIATLGAQIPDANGGWTMPSFLGSFLIKVAVIAFGLWQLQSAGNAQPHKTFRRWTLRSAALTITSALDQYCEMPLKKWRYATLSIASLTLIAVFLNLNNLGHKSFPLTGYNETGEVRINLKSGDQAVAVWIAQLAGNVHYRVECNGIDAVKDMGRNFALSWGYIALQEPCSKDMIVKWDVRDKAGKVTEVLFTDAAHKKLEPKSVCTRLGTKPEECIAAVESPLFDESKPIERIPFPHHGAILDEFYNAGPGASLILNHPIETPKMTSHPYVGRWFIYKAMQVFGVGAFGWRFPAAIASALLPLAVFFLGRLVLRHELWAIFAATLSFLDLIRIGSGRTAYVDSQIALFLVAHYCFLFLAIRWRAKMGPMAAFLLLSWACFAAAAGSKWLGFFPVIVSGPITLVLLCEKWFNQKRIVATISTAVACFVVSSAIYLAPYKVFLKDSAITEVIHHQQAMVVKHSGRSKPKSNIIKTHQAAAGVTDWLYNNVNYRALMIPFHPGGPLAIYIFGNPFIWWSIPIALFYLLARRKEQLSAAGWLLMAAYLAQVLPWLIIRRYSFPYHYMTPAAFGAVLIPAAMMQLESLRNRRLIAWGVVGSAAIAFLLFLPSTLGIPLDVDRLDMIRWFDRWFFELKPLEP